MTTPRSSGPAPLSLRPPSPAVLPDLPPISALFLIDFDVKAGYTIAWKQAIPGLELEGVVEYKSLPSGLHTVSEDLIYFIHDGGYAGLSAFVNRPTDEEDTRHARMIAVGVLVPLSYGRLGRSWRHAEGLMDMARQLATSRKEMQILQRYWDKNKAQEVANAEQLKDSPLSSPSVTFQSSSTTPTTPRGHSRKRSASDANVLIPPGHRLSPYHPAWSLTSLLDTFGPLIFPIHRAALLRKRILISTHAPVHEACNYVYDISVLSNIPLPLLELLDPSAPSQRLRPLFTIGVHDIPFLHEDQAAAAAKKRRRGSAAGREAVQQQQQQQQPDGQEEPGSGWVACTTDSILAMKDDLWDVLVTLPPPHAAAARDKVWPTVELRRGVPVRATQRDLRRFRNLRAGLACLAGAAWSASKPTTTSEGGDGPEEAVAGPAPATTAPTKHHHTPLPPPPPPTTTRPGTSSGLSVLRDGDGDDPLLADAADRLVEPTTWAALAYSGFMWWASAGEQRREEEAEEAARDAALLADLASAPSPRRRGSTGSGGVGVGGRPAPPVMAESVVSLPGHHHHGGQEQEQWRAGGGGAAAAAAATAAGVGGGLSEDEKRARVELAIVVYFRRLTTKILSVLGDIVESGDSDESDDGAEDEDEEEEEYRDSPQDALLHPGDRGDAGNGGDDYLPGGTVRVDSEALGRMGLDVWSEGDAAFAREVVASYFARRAKVESKGVEVCGLRVC